ncbi:MAG: UDP-N-acetylglucosamine 1-carboxyvinyltransferase, partial [Oscillochloris sp.]|nr:UDP-N-acetylglucosamine 1-carboxyvinyltransferase [Oscillochloris sp.]
MDRFVIEGGHRLNGAITPSGNKNAALPLLAAALLTNGRLVLRNVPDIGDVRIKLLLLEQLGVSVEKLGPNAYALQATTIPAHNPDIALARRIR